MSALAHYIEDAGVPTTLIALIKEHAEAMRPPRALWTTFELGRPVGAPEDADFQKRVIRAALDLLERPSGPVFEGFPDDAPADSGNAADDEGWACPVSFAPPKSDAPETHSEAMKREIGQLRPWHESWKRDRGGSGVGLIDAEIDVIADFIGGFADTGDLAPPTTDAPPPDVLKLAISDLMTFYQEAANAQPGKAGGSQAITEWFWTGTAAGKALLAVRERGKGVDDPRLKRVTQGMVLPHTAAQYAAGD